MTLPSALFRTEQSSLSINSNSIEEPEEPVQHLQMKSLTEEQDAEIADICGFKMADLLRFKKR